MGLERLAKAFAQFRLNTVEVESLRPALSFNECRADVVPQALPRSLVDAFSGARRQTLGRRLGYPLANGVSNALVDLVGELLLPGPIAARLAECAAELLPKATGGLRASATDRAHRRLNRLIQLLYFMCCQCHCGLLPSCEGSYDCGCDGEGVASCVCLFVAKLIRRTRSRPRSRPTVGSLLIGSGTRKAR